MRLMLIAALAATMYGQEAAKVERPKDTATQVTTDRHLTETEVLKLKLTQAQIELLQKKYDIESYQKALKPLSDEQVAVAKSACLSVGVPESKILLGQNDNECGINIGTGPDGSPLLGADGKPQAPRVWWARPVPDTLTNRNMPADPPKK